jgi:hypothetical protein
VWLPREWWRSWENSLFDLFREGREPPGCESLGSYRVARVREEVTVTSLF